MTERASNLQKIVFCFVLFVRFVVNVLVFFVEASLQLSLRR
jgi:hypothetical protein